MQRRQQRPEWQQRIAEERIQILLGLAREELEKNPERSRRYVGLARKIGTRYNVRMTRGDKESFCRKCDTIMVQGRTQRTRLDDKTKSVIIKCLHCDYFYRKPYK